MKKLILPIIFFILHAYVYSQVKFTASAEKVVQVGENFKLIFSVNDNAGGFRSPQLAGFEVLSGPNSSTSSSFQFINGQTSQSITTSYSYYLQATKEGKFKIGPAQITVDGKTYSSNSLEIEVIKGEKPVVDNNNNGNNNSNNAGTSSEDLFVNVSLNKTSVYRGEHIIATIKIYTKVGLVSFNDMKFPAYTGFWSQDIKAPTQIQLERETFNGKVYDVGLIKQSILFPQKTGTLTIDPYEIELVVQEKAGKARNFWGQVVDQYQNVTKKLKSRPLQINVKPLPGDEPANFSGIVGSNFKLSVTADNQNIKTDEGITFMVNLSGNGNLNLLNEINLEIPNSFEKYPPKIKENINHSISGSSGSKSFEYFVLAREAGKFNIQPIQFVYFDIKSGQYRTLSSDAFEINVAKGSGTTTQVVDPVNQNDIETLKNDIRYIKRNVSFEEKGKIFAKSNLFYFLYVFSFLIFSLIIVWKRKQIKENADISKMKNKKAGKIIQRHLKTTEKFLQTDNRTAFYKEMIKGLWSYLGDKLVIEQAQLTKDKITEVLTEKKISLEVISKLKNILETCEYAQYGPVGEAGNPQKLFSDAKEIILELENSLKLS